MQLQWMWTHLPAACDFFLLTPSSQQPLVLSVFLNLSVRRAVVFTHYGLISHCPDDTETEALFKTFCNPILPSIF